jgi:nitrogen PTS system EIIA component
VKNLRRVLWGRLAKNSRWHLAVPVRLLSSRHFRLVVDPSAMMPGDQFSKFPMIPEMRATERWPAIVELVDLLVAKTLVKPADRDQVLGALRSREEVMSTGIGFGIAIPHAISDRLEKVAAALGRSSRGIEFSALDNKPVHLIVLFVVPKDQFQTHLRTLAALARFLKGQGGMF